MKYNYFTGLVIALVLLAACNQGPIPASLRPLFPELPTQWQEILGGNHWRLEWLSEDGLWQEWEVPPGAQTPLISLSAEWTTPVLAWPFWPSWNLPAGVMRPAGALFPWDSAGEKLKLNWMGGVDAIFWKELALAYGAQYRSDPNAPGRPPWFFDWPRFRELFQGENISDAVQDDPWLADWKDISQKTVQSGFDRRRIVAQNFSELTIPGMGGFWLGSSPFAPPIETDTGGPLVLNVADTTETWVSSRGILKCSSSGWVFIPVSP